MGEITGREWMECCATGMYREDQGEGVQDNCKSPRPALVWAETWALKKAQEKEIGDRRIDNAKMDVRSYETG